MFEELKALREEVKTLCDDVKILRDENKELKGKLAKNSQNSSKPPSSDGYQKLQPKSLRKSSGQSSGKQYSGGQSGHSGSRLDMVEQTDHVVSHTVDECRQCGRSLQSVEASDVPRRQVIDLPHPRLRLHAPQKTTSASSPASNPPSPLPLNLPPSILIAE